MNCREAISEIRRCFDDDVKHSPEIEGHLAECENCRSEADELSSMDGLLHSLPFDAPAGMEDKVVSALMHEHSRRNNPAILLAFAVCVVISTIAIDWFAPLEAAEQRFLDYANRWVPDVEALGSGQSYRAQFEGLWSSASSLVSRIEWVSTTMMWSALLSSVVLLVIVNGVGVARLRHTSR